MDGEQGAVLDIKVSRVIYFAVGVAYFRAIEIARN